MNIIYPKQFQPQEKSFTAWLNQLEDFLAELETCTAHITAITEMKQNITQKN